jgi:dienelactone hydrolase
MRFVRWCVRLALILLTPGCAALMQPQPPAGPDAVQIPSVPVEGTRMPFVPIPAAFKLPPGKGPFPAVIVLHGCAGRGASQLDWAHRLNDWGYAALVPDSMTPRGVMTVCDPDQQAFVTPRDRVGDVMAAVMWLRTRPEIDPRRIAVLGQSHGGATAALATSRIYNGYGLRAAVDYYGACSNPEAKGPVPLLVLAGEADDWGHPAARCRLYGAALLPDQTFEIHTYPGVSHAFENARLVHTEKLGHALAYDQPAAEDSFVRVHAFLDRWVKR